MGRQTRSILDDALAAGLTLLTSFMLLPWSIVVGVTGGVLLKRAQVAERVARLRQEQRLRNLYEADAGLLR